MAALAGANPNVDFWQDMVNGLIINNNRVVGVRTGMGQEFHAKAVVLTNGTFLNGVIHIGEKHFGGGRSGEKAATGITEQLVSLGFQSGRMKTGTLPDSMAVRSIIRKQKNNPATPFPGAFLTWTHHYPIVNLVAGLPIPMTRYTIS